MKAQKFSSKRTLWLTIALLLGAALLLAACGTSEPATPCPEVECPDCPEVSCPEAPKCPELTCPEPEVGVEVPFEALWASSGHNDTEAEAFNHWNEDDPPVVSSSCARCHSTPGYRDYIGADGTEAGVVDNEETPIGTTVECVACHNDATLAMTSVVFPSGVEVTGLGDESRCMQCHQGRNSTVSVNAGIEEAGLTEDVDTVSEDIGFSNIHYYPAGVTLYGGVTMGGYQYDGKMYDAKFTHVEEIDTCIDCHNPHTLEIKVDVCADCHEGVASADDLKNARMKGSKRDYDGDGDKDEGVYYEIVGLQEILYAAMQAYGADVAGAGIVYDAHSYPYFFDEAGERYGTWTARLAKAAYNYQYSMKDPGAFAHGGKYMIQLLYDSIEDLDADLAAGLTRDDAGHFAGSKEAFRHWDEDGEVSSSCARCHSATGLPTYLKEGVNVSAPLSNGMLCTTCHDNLDTFERHEVETVKFPSGASLSIDPNNNLCISCHQGRESSKSISSMNEGLDPDTVDEGVRFRNIHYFAAGATLFGGEAMGAAQFEGKEYAGRNAHIPGYDNCIACHGEHGLTLRVSECATCHGTEDVRTIRMSSVDYDGDGDASEGLAEEVATMADALYAAIQAYATDVVGTGIVYDSHAYPYFFDEAGERYGTWTPRLAQAAFNYQYYLKDPGTFAHNGKYIMQILYDTLEDLGADVSGMTRPEVASE
ncbi:MAG: cytochrome c3 family protein [Anaerolineae bacterium]